MTEPQPNLFSANASLTGYLYQCLYALLDSLRRLRGLDPFSVSIETLDDVVFETEGQGVELLQTKHHVNREGNLTDASPDLWKTLRIWCEGVTAGNLPADTTFAMVTTGVAPEGAAATYLRRGDGRDVAAAKERLDQTALTSTSQQNKAAYEAYKAVGDDARVRMLGQVTVYDQLTTIDGLEKALLGEVYTAAPREFLKSFLARLLGWWLGRVIHHLLNPASPILSEELQDEIDRLREQFKEDSLPIDDDIMDAAVDRAAYDDRVFVKQLQLIGVGDGRILHAIRNFYRAFTHRSRWAQEELLSIGELGRYEDRLREAWDLRFHQMRDRLGEGAAEEAMSREAKTLYEWVETGDHRRLRPGISEPAIATGSYQMLADRQHVGWHPEFAERLEALLEGEGAGE